MYNLTTSPGVHCKLMGSNLTSIITYLPILIGYALTTDDIFSRFFSIARDITS